MIDIKTLKPKDRGSWVRYRDHFEHRALEYGRLKSWNTSVAWVVFRTDDRWDQYEHYTGESTDPDDLVLLPTFCPKDQTLLVPGKSLRSTLHSSTDDLDGEIATVSNGGSGSLVECLKCPICGYSVV